MNTSKVKLDFTPTLRKIHANVEAKNIHGDLACVGFVKRMTDLSYLRLKVIFFNYCIYTSNFYFKEHARWLNKPRTVQL